MYIRTKKSALCKKVFFLKNCKQEQIASRAIVSQLVSGANVKIMQIKYEKILLPQLSVGVFAKTFSSLRLC
jgi:hypothetical protein